MCYLGKEYGNSPEIPKLVFISLDSGGEDEDDDLCTINQIRSSVEINPPQNCKGKDKIKHWYQTFDLAKIILSSFIQESLKIDECYVNPYIVHTNSAKCSQKKDKNAEADGILFKNCKEYSAMEIQLLKPEIVVSQGVKADDVLGCFEETDRVTFTDNEKSLTIVTRKIDNKIFLHISLYHPRYGYYRSQKKILVNNIEKIKAMIIQINKE
jgi:hypothetical protein